VIDNSREQSISYLLHLFCSHDRTVFAYLRLGKRVIVKGTIMHIRVAMHTAEVTTTATIDTYTSYQTKYCAPNKNKWACRQLPLILSL